MWTDFNLHPKVVDIITNQLKFEKPTDVQAEILPFHNSSYDLLTAAKTGSGKTLCFVLPIISKIFYSIDQSRVEGNQNTFIDAIVFAPTRDSAIQITESFNKFKTEDYKEMSTISILGGLSKQKQIRLLKRIPNIIVATPGRLWELMDSNMN